MGEKSFTLILYDIILFVASGIFCHAVALLSSIQSLQTRNRYGRLQTIGYLILGLIASSSFYNAGYFISKNFHEKQAIEIMHWFGASFNLSAFILVSLCIFMTWAMVGIYRSLREELLFKNNIPWVWGLFIVFLMVYSAGFIDSPANTRLYLSKDSGASLKQYSLVSAFLIGICSTYFMFFYDKINITRYRSFLYQIKSKNWVKIGEFIPRWLVSFVLTIIVGIMFLRASLDVSNNYNESILIISFFMFIVRDAGILHYFKFSKNNKRASLATIFYLAILYILLPSIFMAAELKDYVYIFYPLVEENANIAWLLPILAQICLVSYLLYYRWKETKVEI